MIVRNEERNLPDCLASCTDLFDDVVIVDTGSTDQTKAIAASARDRHGVPARVFEFPWCDSFAAARNETLRHARGDWIFWMDADDRLDDANRRKLGKLLATLGDNYECFEMGQVSTFPDGQIITTWLQMRLFPHRPHLRWWGRIHEGLVGGADMPRINAEIDIWHVGYRDPMLLDAKSHRNLRLLEMQIAETPKHEVVLFHLAREYFIQGRTDDGCRVLERLDALGTEEAAWLAKDVRERVLPTFGPRASGQVHVETIDGLSIGGTIIA